MIIDTDLGHYATDPHDNTVLHYRFTRLGHISTAIADALKHARTGEFTCWFWFNGTPAIMRAGDDAAALGDRWSRVRSEMRRTPTAVHDISDHLARLQ